MLAGAALRLFHVGKESLWLDEAFSVSIARTTITQIIDETSHDFHPPLYYVILYYWVHWLDSLDATARLLSVVFSLGTILATWALGRRLFGRTSALIAAALVAFSRFQIEFAQEARMYALLALLGAVASYCLIRWCALAVERPNSRSRLGWLAAHAGMTALMTYTHVYSVFLIAGHAMTVAGEAWHRRRAGGRRLVEHWFIAQLLVVAAFLPWLSVLAWQFDSVQRGFWIGETHPSMVVWPFITYAGSVPLALVLVPFAAWGLMTTRSAAVSPSQSSARIVLVPWLVCPIVLPLILSLVGSPIFLPKYTIAASVPFALLAGHGLARVRGRTWQVTTVILLAVLSTWPAVDTGVARALTALDATSTVRNIAAGSTLTTYYARQRKDGWRDAVWNIEQQAQPGDAVIFYPFFNQIPFDVYLQRRDLVELPFPKVAGEFTTETLAATLRTMAAPHRRVWFVVLQLDARKPLLVTELERLYDRVTRIREWHIDVYFCEGAGSSATATDPPPASGVRNPQ